MSSLDPIYPPHAHPPGFPVTGPPPMAHVANNPLPQFYCPAADANLAWGGLAVASASPMIPLAANTPLNNSIPMPLATGGAAQDTGAHASCGAESPAPDAFSTQSPPAHSQMDMPPDRDHGPMSDMLLNPPPVDPAAHLPHVHLHHHHSHHYRQQPFQSNFGWPIVSDRRCVVEAN